MTRTLLPALLVLSISNVAFFGNPTRAEQPAKTAATDQAKKVAEAQEKQPSFVRIERDRGGEPLGLQTAIVHFGAAAVDKKDLAEKKDLVVDLIGAVHVGEKAYYEALNDAFKKYDVVLYEMVTRKGFNTEDIKKAKASGHPISIMQNGMKDFLDLEHQLQHIDYTKANLVHADMSPEEFAKSMEDRGESFTGLFFRMMGQGVAQQAKAQSQGKSTDTGMLLALFDSDRNAKMKRMLAAQFEDLESSMQAFDGPQGSTIITQRNKVALEELGRQIAQGKKKIGIFYGAGHFPDMEKRLETDFGLQRSGQDWLTAWDLRLKNKIAKPAGATPAKAAARS